MAWGVKLRVGKPAGPAEIVRVFESFEEADAYWHGMLKAFDLAGWKVEKNFYTSGSHSRTMKVTREGTRYFLDVVRVPK